MKARMISTTLAAVLAAGALTGAYNAAAAHVNAQPTQQVQPPAVINGHVTMVRGATVTVATASRPVCPQPLTPEAGGGSVRCNAIVAGAAFQVDTSHAIFETVAGATMQGAQSKLAVGDAVVVVGTRASGGASASGAAPLVRATVIQRTAPCAGR